MENNDNMILTDQSIGKEYQIPELVDLNWVGEANAVCGPGSSPTSCGPGSGDGFG